MRAEWQGKLEWLFLRAFLGVPLLFVLLHLYGLDRAKVPWYDEVMYAAPGHYLWAEGRYGYGHEPGVAQLDEVALRAPPFSSWIVAGWYGLVGFSAYRTSLLYLLAGAGALFFLAHWLRRLLTHWEELADVTPWLVLLTTLLLATDRLFAWTIRAGRPESMGVLFACAALFVSCRAKSDPPLSWRRMLAAGVLGGVGMNVHLLVALTAPAVLLQWFCLNPPPRDAVRSLAAFALGGLLVFLPWALVALSHWDAFQVQFFGNVDRHTQVDLLEMVKDELQLRWLTAYMAQPLHLLVLAVFGGGALAALSRGERRASVGLGAALAVAVLTFLIPKGVHIYYLAYALPVVYGAVACGLASWRRRIDEHPRADSLLRIGKGVLLLVLVNGLLVSNTVYLYVAWTLRERRSQERLERLLEERIPRGAVVAGPVEVWYAARRLGYTYYLNALHSHVSELEATRAAYDRGLHRDPTLQYLLVRRMNGRQVWGSVDPTVPFPAARLGRRWELGEDWIGPEGPWHEWFVYTGGWRLRPRDSPMSYTLYEVLPPSPR